MLLGMKATGRFLTLPLLIALVPSCTPKDDVKKSEDEVAVFHQRWNQWDFTGVYNNAHVAFRSAQDPQRTISQLKRSRQAYGAFKSATPRGMEISSKNSEKEIILKYNCVYEHGTAAEAFTFQMTDGKPLLHSYYMLSPDKAAQVDAEDASRKAQGNTGK